MWNTDLFLFESAYIRELFRRKVGEPGARARVVHNGVNPTDFTPVTPIAEATDIVFVGELRAPKAVDVLLAAIRLLADRGRKITATMVGDGPDRAALEAQARTLGLGKTVSFVGAKPARSAFGLGRVLVIPSRAESLPYIVLEALAAGVPLITTNVGGIPEIYGPDAGMLLRPGDTEALARAIDEALAGPRTQRTALASLRERLQARLHAGFTVDAMTDAVLAAYGEALAQRAGSRSS
jgi:glycosyltransferase involved in cell wall biosynthesis